jgi:HAMP domain-containing protein
MLPPSTDPAQRRMEKDTADLLRLVRELKAEVNKAGSNTLSVAAVQKADEIQRLVKSLKEQMRERGLVVVNKP